MFATRYTIDFKSNRRRRGLAKVVLACVTTLLVLAPVAVAQSGDSQGALAAPIEGTWILSIHRVAQDITFSALQSFTAGGVMIATGTADRTPPPPISPLYGSWARAAGNSYVGSICFFVFDGSGNAIAMIKTLQAFQMGDNDHLTGSGTAFACGINGDNCVNVNSPVTITGKRLVAQGPPN